MKKLSRSYFETKVVKVRKEKTPGPSAYLVNVENDDTLRGLRDQINAELKRRKEAIKRESKGNWVNWENLDKIKFPCFCSFESQIKDFKRYGELDKVRSNELDYFRLRELKQVEKRSVCGYEYYRLDLDEIIKFYDVHILKGKIILFEEEK